MQITSEMMGMLQAIQCATGERRLTYISGPITTGPRWANLLRLAYVEVMDLEASAKARAEVLAANESDIIFQAEKLRVQGEFVIEPASLRMPNWKQADYYSFWYEVLNRFVNKVVVLDGWEYSVGCVNEVRFARDLGIPVETVSGLLLTPQDASLLIAGAASDLIKDSRSSEQLIEAASKLNELAQGFKNAY